LALALTACGGGGFRFDVESDADSHANPHPTPDPTPAPSSCVDKPHGRYGLVSARWHEQLDAVEEYKVQLVCDHFELVTETDGDQSFKIGDSRLV
jgi:uncharacterized protein (DUF2237 family)